MTPCTYKILYYLPIIYIFYVTGKCYILEFTSVSRLSSDLCIAAGGEQWPTNGTATCGGRSIAA